MNDQEKENLIIIYKLILSSPELLISTAGMRNWSIRDAYESIIAELKKLEPIKRG